MATAEERKRILNLIKEGKISAEEGARLLNALGSAGTSSKRRPSATTGRSGKTPRWVRVRVTDTITGKTKTSVNIPFALLDWGLQIGAQYAPEVSHINLSQLNEMLEEGAMGKIVDVFDEKDGEHVEIFIE